MNTSKKMLTVEEARHILDIGRNGMYKLVKKKGFPTTIIGRQIRISPDLLETWIMENSN